MNIYTLEMLQEERNIKRQSALNLISRLKKNKRVKRKGKLYYIYDTPQEEPNGLYAILNKTPVKLHPTIQHYVHGTYTVEQAIVDALETKDVRHCIAAAFILNRISHWTTLVQELKKKNLLPLFKYTYETARKVIRVSKMPKRYKKMLQTIQEEKIHFNENDIRGYKYD